MLTLLTELLIGTVIGTLVLLGICVVLTVGKYTIKMVKLFLEEIKWLNKGISELVVPRKQK
jgi:hypothetical protein